jgi:hypothetical protein
VSALPVFGAQRPPHDPAVLVRGILAQSRFRIQAAAAPSHTWWDQLRNWVGEQWTRLMDAFAHHVKIGPRASVAIGDVLIALLALLVVGVGLRLLLGAVRSGTPARGVIASPLAPHANAHELWEAAQHAAAAGAFASAIALAFRAVLATLDTRGVLRDDPARTVNECRRDVRARAPRLSAAFETIARIFTAAVYAEDRVGIEQWSEVERAYGTFLSVNDAA